MRDREASGGATGWVTVSVAETGCRGRLLISQCDLGQDTNSSGSRDSQAQAVPGALENRDYKSLPFSRPSPEANWGPLKLTPKLPQGQDRGLASLQYSWCQAHPPHTPSTGPPRADHTPSTCQPHDICRPTIPPHTPSTHQPLTIHLPPHNIHMSSLSRSHATCMPSTHKLHAVSMPPIACHVPSTHTHMLAIRVLRIPSQMRTRHQVRTPRTSQPDPGLGHLTPVKTCSPSPVAQPAAHLCRCNPPG